MKSKLVMKSVITGVNNPVVTFYLNKFNDDFIVKVDNERVDFSKKKSSGSTYIITAIIPVGAKLVTLEYKKKVIYAKRNLYISRLLNKVSTTFLNFFTTTYEFNENVGVQDIIINGILNPKVTTFGSIKLNKYKFILKADDEVIDYDNIAVGSLNTFYIEAILPKKTKIITLLIEDNGKISTVFIKRNFIISRIFRKLKTVTWSFIIKTKVAFIVLFRGIKFLWKEHKFLVPFSLWKKYFLSFMERIKKTNIIYHNPMDQGHYLKWLKVAEKKTVYVDLKYKPLISLLIPVYNVSGDLLKECIVSVLNQSYQNFEICLADDKSTNRDTLDTLEYYSKFDDRIKIVYREKNGHISAATNSALKIAKGEFCGLMDNDDVLHKDALYEVVKVLNENKKLDFIYSDEDKLDLSGVRCDPHFKPDFSPDTLMSLNYICHFSVIRTSLINKVGGFELGLEGSQDHDLFLKVSENTNNIYHIPKVLYHWRKVEGSTSLTITNKLYANDKGKLAIENALKRRKIKGKVVKDKLSTYYLVDYDVSDKPSISIIIPTRDYASTLETCLESLYKLTTYDNFEVIIMNNQSVEQETFDLFNKYKKMYKSFKVVDVNTEFNYSNINNIGVEESNGDFVVLLNNDTEIITPNWLEVMVGYARLSHVGAVGAKLLYPDKTIQHAGVIMGLGGVASHAYIGASREDLGLYGRLRVPYNYSAVTAACLMVERKKFKAVNGLEETLKVAYNDVDFNLKLLDRGFYNLFLPQVELIHFESKSRGLDTTTEKYKRFLKESEYMNNKWKIPTMEDRFYNPNFAKKAWFLLDCGVKDEKKS